MKPVTVIDRPNDAAGPARSKWQFAFEVSNELPQPVETAACRLLTELLHPVIAYRHDLDSVAAITREQAELACHEIDAAGIHSIHGAIIWCYDQLAEYLSLDVRVHT